MPSRIVLEKAPAGAGVLPASNSGMWQTLQNEIYAGISRFMQA
jgi:hypothetical protein